MPNPDTVIDRATPPAKPAVTAKSAVPTTPTAKPHRIGAKLTRAGMEDAIKNGGSVLHEGKIYSNIAQLPTEADLAKDDPEQAAKVKADLEKQIEELKGQVKTLESAKAPTGEPAKK